MICFIFWVCSLGGWWRFWQQHTKTMVFPWCIKHKTWIFVALQVEDVKLNSEDSNTPWCILMGPTEAVGNCVEHLESDLETTERPATEAFLEAGQDSKVGDLVRYSQYSRFMFLKIPFAFTEMHWNAVFAVNKGTWIISHSETSENQLVWTDYSYLWCQHVGEPGTSDFTMRSESPLHRRHSGFQTQRDVHILAQLFQQYFI